VSYLLLVKATLQQIAIQQTELTQQVDTTVCDLEKERHLLTEQQKKVNYSVDVDLKYICLFWV
jgi:hypothetical protein